MELGYKIHGSEVYPVYGIVFPKGLDKQLLKLPVKKKSSTDLSYSDHNGTERSNVDSPFYESATLSIDILFKAESGVEFFHKYGAFTEFILKAGYFNFDVARMGRRFKLLYSEMSSFDKLTAFSDGLVGCTATLVLINDFPTEYYPIPD